MAAGHPCWWVTCVGHARLCREHSTAPSRKLPPAATFLPWDPQGFRPRSAPLQPAVLAASEWKGIQYPTPVMMPVLGRLLWPFGLWP